MLFDSGGLRGRRASLLELNNSAPHADRDGLGAVTGTQLFHNVLDVNLASGLCDEESLRDVLIPVFFSHIPKNLGLA